MIVKIKDSDGKMHSLCDVEQILCVSANLTLCEELKNSIIVIHGSNHMEKYRLYKGGIIISVEEN